MNAAMRHYQKRYNLDIIERDGIIEEIYFTRNDKKLKMNKEDGKWICKDDRFVFSIPDIT